MVLIEGVMGLFDGRDPASLEGSTAELAQQLDVPVVLVVDASGMARSAAAIVEGFARHAEGVSVVGAVFNRVGSVGHTRIIQTALEQSALELVCLGGLPKSPELSTPERHLGLVSGEFSGMALKREALSEWASAHLDLDALVALAKPARVQAFALSSDPPAQHVRIGVARDEAFHFYYPDNMELLIRSGAELVHFSPLQDHALPDGLDALLIGGGYPELHAETLAGNGALREQIQAFAASGRPIYGECGGLMYLGESLEGEDGESFEMLGVLPVRTRMHGRLRTLGYREVTTSQDSILGPAGTYWRGHEFHYSQLVDQGGASAVFDWTGRRGQGREGFVGGPSENVLGTYIHAHWARAPEVAQAFVDAAYRSRP
ncbi:MAG: cobyrinic acid a,c-diamide synthase [Cognaticolwellia sp.]